MSYTFTLSNPIPDPQYFETAGNNGCYLVSTPNGLYFLAVADVGGGLDENNDNLCIWKSSDGGLNWTRIVYSADLACGDFAVTVIGEVIYICIRYAPISESDTLGMYRFDTSTDTFLADDYAGPSGAGLATPTMLVPWLDGSIMALYARQAWQRLVNWAGPGSWGESVLVYEDAVKGVPEIAWALRETSTDRAHAFYAKWTNPNYEIRHLSINKPSTISASHLIGTQAGLAFGDFWLGMPAIWDAQSQVVMPYLDDSGTLHVIHGDLADNPTWENEVIDTSSLVGLTVGGQDAIYVTGRYSKSAAVVQGDTLFVIFTAFSGVDPAIQSYLCETHTALGSGGWSAPTIIFSPAGATGIASPFPVAISDSQFGVMTASFQDDLANMGVPESWVEATSRTVVFTDGSPAIQNGFPSATIQYAGTGTTLTAKVIHALSNELTVALKVNGVTVESVVVPAATAEGATVSVAISGVNLVEGDTISFVPTGEGTGEVLVTANYEIPAPEIPPSTKFQSLRMQYVGAATEAPTPPVLECANPPAGTVGMAYSHQMTLTGGTSPYSVAVTGGALPDGLSIDDAGLITGTPTVAGTFAFTVTATDDSGLTATAICSITIQEPPPCLWLDLWVWKQLQQFTSLDQEVVLPPGYDRLIRACLAIELAAQYGRKVSPAAIAMAQQAEKEIGDLNESNARAIEDLPPQTQS